MLLLPDKGVRQSPTEKGRHNVEVDILCDWIEGNVLFGGDEFSTIDFIDILMENNVYDSQDFASGLLENAWAELQRRQRYVSTVPSYALEGKRIVPLQSWDESPAYAFCLLLSLARAYSAWNTQIASSGYSEQGELFELLTKVSLENQFGDWTVYQTGWSRGNTKNLAQVVEEISNILGELPGNLENWTRKAAKDAGLDLLCYRPFIDGRVGVPVYLLQCASGVNWEEKVYTPDLNIWTKIIVFAACPKKAFALPFSLLDRDFSRNCASVNGMLLDRGRILAANNNDPDWLPSSLRQRLIAWSEPRVASLPKSELYDFP